MLRVFVDVAGRILLLGAVLGMLIEGLQVGVRLEPAALAPRLSRLSPSAAVRRLAAAIPHELRKLLFSLCFFLLLACCGRALAARAPALFFLSPPALLHLLGDVVCWICCALAAGLMLCGACEYWLQRRSFLSEMSMSFEELREEQRESEGDPQMRAARRAEHERLVRQDIVQRVRQARVIVVEENERG